MSDEIPTLGEFIDRAVREWADTAGAGIALGYTCAVEFMQADGQLALITTQPNEQPTWKSLGLVGWLSEWYRDDARNIMYSACEHSGDDD